MATLVTSAIRHNSSASNNVVLDSNGRVGIGTAAPASSLHVQTANESIIRNHATSGSAWFVGNAPNGMILHNETNSPTLITTNGVERMRIDASGRVTMPSQPFAYVEGAPIAFEGSGTTGVLTGGTTIYSTNSFYNSTNGRFTAPVAGNYLVSFSGLTHSSDSNDTQVSVQVNDVQRGRSYTGGTTAMAWRPNIFIGVFRLNVNDYVTFNKTAGTLHTGAFPYRTVYLLG